MSQQDRSYDRESQRAGANPLSWLLGGSLPVMHLANLRVRVHASLLLLVAVVIAVGGGEQFVLEHRLYAMAVLVVLLLGHELGRSAAARVMGGYADEVVLWPMGGLGDPQAPHRPTGRAFSVLAGMAVVAAVGAAAAAVLHWGYDTPIPFSLTGLLTASQWGPSEAGFYLWYLYVVSYLLLLVNMLPILPLDGGHLLQSALWTPIGFGRSVVAACNVGIVASIVAGAYGVATGHWILFALMVGCMFYCVQRRATVKTVGVDTFDQFELETHATRRHRLGRIMKWRVRRQIRREAADQARLDEILEKVHRRGIQCLSWGEKRVLRRATQRQRESVEVS